MLLFCLSPVLQQFGPAIHPKPQSRIADVLGSIDVEPHRARECRHGALPAADTRGRQMGTGRIDDDGTRRIHDAREQHQLFLAILQKQGRTNDTDGADIRDATAVPSARQRTSCTRDAAYDAGDAS